MPFALRARALWKSYAAGIAGCSARVWVLRGASLEVERGECVAVLGSRGAGTTTLLHCLAGLRRTDAGSIELGLSPHLVNVDAVDTVEAERPSAAERLILYDDGMSHRARPAARLVREHARDASATIIATHELSRVKGFADRILLLHHGRLTPLEDATGARRVAEQTAEIRG